MDIIVSMLAVVAIAFFFVAKFKLNSAVAPFFTIASIILFICIFGTFNLLVPAIIAVYAFAVFSLVYVFYIRRKDIKQNLKLFFSPGLAVFLAASVFFAVVLSSKGASFQYWDEFSFWGMSAKTIFDHKQLYTLFSSSLANTSYPPGLPGWSFFLQFLGGEFAEWKVYFAYTVLHFAVMSIFFSRIEWKNVGAVIAAAAFSVFGIYVFLPSFDGMIYYSNCMSDFIVGMAFAASLMSWFSDGEKSFKRYIVAIVSVMLLPYLKDMGLVLGLVAATVISFDMVISNGYPSDNVFKKKNAKALRLIYPLLLFAAVAASYLSWTLHFNSVKAISRIEFPYEYSMFEILTGKDPYFIEMLNHILDTVSTYKLTTFAPMVLMSVLLVVVPTAVSILTKSKIKIIRTAVFSVLMFMGFVLYIIFHAYLYTAIFGHTENYDLISFNRYMSSYAIGWFMAAAGLCLFDITKPFFKKLTLSVGSAVLVIILAAHFIACEQPLNQYMVASKEVIVEISEIRQLMDKQMERYDRQLISSDKVYFVCQESSGGEWFVFNYEAQPAYVVSTYGGGNFVPMDTAEDALQLYDIRADKETFEQYLREEGVNYIFLMKTNGYFESEFREMFEDNLVYFYDGTSRLYRVYDDGTNMSFLNIINANQLLEYREMYDKERTM